MGKAPLQEMLALWNVAEGEHKDALPFRSLETITVSS